MLSFIGMFVTNFEGNGCSNRRETFSTDRYRLLDHILKCRAKIQKKLVYWTGDAPVTPPSEYTMNREKMLCLHCLCLTKNAELNPEATERERDRIVDTGQPPATLHYSSTFSSNFTARCYASAAYAVMRCPSVCPSVCHVRGFCQSY